MNNLKSNDPLLSLPIFTYLCYNFCNGISCKHPPPPPKFLTLSIIKTILNFRQTSTILRTNPSIKISREIKSEKIATRISISALSKCYSTIFLATFSLFLSETLFLHPLVACTREGSIRRYGFCTAPLIAAPPPPPPSSSLLFSASTPAVSIIDQFPFRGPGNRTHL